MDVKHPFVFQVDSKIVKEIYNNRKNYKIVFDESCQNRSTCAIYFSSNDIYFPNKESIFRKRIVEKDAFEWYNTRINNVYKHIFVRDIFKQWYLQGINHKLNSIEKVDDFFKNEIEGFDKVITVGSSAGGFAAVLFGSFLNAERVLAFNAQFEVESLLSTSKETIDPILFRNKNTSLANYYDIKPLINEQVDVFYFYSINSIWDRKQYQHIKNVNAVKSIPFKTKHHGIPFLKNALTAVINLKKNELKILSNSRHHPILFSIKMVGFSKVIIGIYKQLIDKYKRKK